MFIPKRSKDKKGGALHQVGTQLMRVKEEFLNLGT